MKNPLVTISLCAAGCWVATNALADNMSVEAAIKNRPELSSFYQAMVNTGVNHELHEGQSYTIFAPTNAAFARIRQDKYPCFYTADCKTEVAAIVRNHIVAGDVYIDDAAKQRGGVYSIGKRFVTIGTPSRNDVAIAGNNVVYTSAIGSNILYIIDGVIASPYEMASFEYGVESQPQQQSTKVTKKTIPDPACGVGGCADETTETTTFNRVVTEPLLSPSYR